MQKYCVFKEATITNEVIKQKMGNLDKVAHQSICTFQSKPIMYPTTKQLVCHPKLWMKSFSTIRKTDALFESLHTLQQGREELEMIHVFVEGYDFAMAIRQALTSTYGEVGLPLLVVGREVRWGEDKDSIAKIKVKKAPADYVSEDESKSDYAPPTGIDHEEQQRREKRVMKSRVSSVIFLCL